MAKMLPYPIEKFNNIVEENLYRLFETRLNDDDYTVLYSRTWSQVSKGDNPDPECDFIITKLGQGILIVEAKGGRWERKNGNWAVYGKEIKNSENPINQARSNKKALINLLRKHPKWERTFFPISYCIALPDTRFPSDFPKDGLPPILSLDEIDFVDDWVAESMQDCIQQSYPSVLTQAMYDYLVETLMKDYTIESQRYFRHQCKPIDDTN